MHRFRIKLTGLLILFCLAISAGLFAQLKSGEKMFKIESANKAVNTFKTNFKSIEKNYESKYHELESQYYQALQTEYSSCLKNLEKARMEAMGEDELDEAVRIRSLIKRMEASPPPKHPFGNMGAVGAGSPPKEAVEFKGNRYLLITKHLPITEAAKACEKMGGHLARIESSQENGFVAGLLAGVDEKRAWIDGSDAASEGKWVFSDGRDMKYFSWKTKMLGDEPNNGGKSEHWIQISNDGSWYDEDAGKRVAYICEWEY